MKAWLLPTLTGLSSLTLTDVPNPTPAPNEIILSLQFAALNPADRYLAQNQYPAKPTLPHILGRDGIGTVLAVGSHVTDIRPGETRLILRSEVGVSRPGTLAQQVAVEASYTVPLPDGWSLQQAAAAPLVYLTAWQALNQFGSYPPNATLLITGASGGVGVATLQLANALRGGPTGEGTLVALSRSEEKSKLLRDLGADLTLNPDDKSWRKQLFAQLGPRPVNLAVDNIGGPLFSEVVETLGMWGAISVVGRLAGPVPDFNTSALLFRRLKIGGIAIASYSNKESLEAWHNVLNTLQKPTPKPLIDSTFPMDQVPAAFEKLQKGPMGKVLIQIQ